jgi:hypothetical protein
MSLADEQLSYPKLPLWHTIRLSYSTYFRHFNDALRASWLWLIIVAALTALATQQQWSWTATAMANHAYPQMPKPTDVIVLSGVNVLALFTGASIAVAWHRLMILDERPGISGSNVTTKDLWRYILVGLALCLMVWLPALPFMFPIFSAQLTAGHGPPPSTFILTIALCSLLQIAGGVVLLRLLMLLPARAIGNTGLTFRQAWDRTRGNFWRLFWGLWLTTLPPVLIVEVALVALVGTPRPGLALEPGFVTRMTIFSTVGSIYYLLIVPIGIGFLSHAYRHFFQAPIERAA